MNGVLPALTSKALVDTGYDLVRPDGTGWFVAAISGAAAKVMVRLAGGGTLLAMPEPGLAARIGLRPATGDVPAGMSSMGLADGAQQLYEALRLLHTLQRHPASMLQARLQARLAGIPETERTRQVLQRVGQDVFREALMDLWQSRCAVTGLALPPALLRASHAKPWAQSSDEERLDPFNGLLLAIHLDAMFDVGLIAFDDEGTLLCSPQLDDATRRHYSIDDGLRVKALLPGHGKYLRWHRERVFRAC